MSCFEYDLSTALTVVDLIFVDQIFEDFVIFSPTTPGMPVLVDQQRYMLLDLFRGGSSVGEVLSRAQSHLTLSFREILDSIVFFQEKGFLQNCGDSKVRLVRSKGGNVKSLGIWLHITDHCNLACAYCFVDKTDEVMSDEAIGVSIEQIVLTIKKYDLKEVSVKLAGGEPSLRLAGIQKFYDQLTTAVEDLDVKLIWAILTNGTVASPKFLALAKKMNASFGVSLDGFAEYHDIYRTFKQSGTTTDGSRPRGSWSIVSKNIDKFIDENLRIQINMTVSAESAPGLPALVQWVAERNLGTRIALVRNLDCDWTNGEGRSERYEEYCKEMALSFDAMFQKLEDEFEYIDPTKIFIGDLSFDKPLAGIPCGVGSNYVTIRHDGKMSSCPMTIAEQSLDSANDLIEGARAAFPYDPEQRGKDGQGCLSCQWFRVCAGGCPVSNTRFNNHPFTRSPLCSFWKYVIPRYIRFCGTMAYRKRYGAENLVDGGGAPSSMETAFSGLTRELPEIATI